jgi:FAD:protein FMN transferase
MNQLRRARPLLGTVVQIDVAAPLDLSALNAAVDAAFDDIARIHSLMSWHDAGSELSRINRRAAGALQPLHPDTRVVLEAALRIARLSDGAFEPCVGGSLARWGLLRQRGPEAPPARGNDAASWRDVELTPRGVRFHRPLCLDLGGIAKGYAVDLALQRLLQLGIADIVVNAGGDLRVAGAREHCAAIRHPQHAHAVAHALWLRNEALATSCDGRDSVSVRAATCMTADALTKVALFAPPEAAEAVFESCRAHCIRLAAAGT